MDINSVKKIGSPGQNVVIETAGKIYVKVQDRFYELDFKNLGKSAQNTITNIVNNNSTPTDLSKYVSKDYLKSALSQYVTTKTWQSVKATQYALQNSDLSGFSESINPITIDTMQLLVGAEQLQYDFVNHLGYYTENSDTKMPTLGGLSTIIYNDPTFSDSIRLVCNPGIIKHYVYNGPEAVQAGMQDFQYCRWIVSESINQDSLSDDDVWEIKHYDFNTDLDWKSQITLPTLNPFIVDLPINDKIYYLYIQAYYMDSNMTRELEWPTITGDSEIAAWLQGYYNIESDSPIIMPISFTFSQLVSLYDSLLGQKKRMIKEDEENFVTNWANEWDDWENKLIKYLYEFKVGTARYVLTETPLGEYEYVYDEDTRQYTDEILAYNFLYAIVGNNGSSGRSITTLNGFTEITPGQVTAYIFKTPDGQQYINFKDGTLHIGNPYEDKKGEWIHYSPDGGLEISGKLTVTGGPLLNELEKLTKLANGEYNIWYSDDAIYADPSLPNWRELEESAAAGLDGVSPKEDVDETSDESGFEQYFPFPNDVDPDRASVSDPDAWYQKKNWPAYLWENPDTRQEHEGDLYVISRNIRINGSTPVTPDSDDERNNEVNLTFRYRSDKVKNSNNEEITIYYWSLLDNSDIGLVLNTLEGYDYLKAALNEPTTIIGGLILTSAIELGYTASDGRRWTTAGISGIKRDITNNTDIAAWFGGYRKDPVEYVNGRTGDARNIDYTVRPSGATWDYPQTLFRLDGSGYIGGLNSDNIPAIQWDAQSLTIRDDISVVDNNGNVISTLGNLGNYFEEYTLPNNAGTAIKLKSKYAGIISDGFISAFGYSGSEGGSGSGDASWPDNPFDGDLLVWNNTEGNPIWVHPEDLTVGTATNALSAGEANQLKTSRSIWGQLFNGSQDISGNMSGVGNIAFGTNAPLFTFTGNNPYLTIQGDLHVTGHIVADSYISAFGTSSSEGSSGGDANSIAGKLVIEPSDWTGLDGKTLIYDSSENDGEGAWVIGNAGISASNSPSDNYLLGWLSSSAQWVNPNSITVGSANYLANGGLTLWGNSNVGTSGNMNVGTSGSVANLSYVGNINFGSTGTSGIYFSTNTPSGTPASTDNLYLKGNLIVSGYISAYGTSSSGGSSSGDASSIGGKDVNISNLSDGQILMYDILDDKWKNVDPDVIPIITLNGSGTTGASFYAPINWGSSAQVLIGNGSGNAPTWTNISSLSVGNSNYANTAGELDDTCYLWGNAFKGNNDIGTVSSPASLSNVGDIGLVNGRSLYIDKYPAGNGALQILTMASDNQLVVGYGLLHNASSSAQYNTYIDGYTVHLRTSKNGDAHVDSVVIEHNGSTSFKNDIGVTGSIVSTGGVSIGGGLTVTGGAIVGGIFNASSSANIGYNLEVGTANASGYGNLTVRGNYIYIKNSSYYLKYEENSGSPYLYTNLPIVSGGFISAYGVSTTNSGAGDEDEGGGEEPDPGGESEIEGE